MAKFEFDPSKLVINDVDLSNGAELESDGLFSVTGTAVGPTTKGAETI